MVSAALLLAVLAVLARAKNINKYEGIQNLLNFEGHPNYLNFDRLRNVLNFDGTDSEDDFDPRVIGGRDALDLEFPFMVSLHYRGRFICSSFLITPNILMTAAHCVVFGREAEDPKHYTGYAGTIHRDGPETEVRFTEIVAHSEYGYDTECDIALMRLAKPLKIGDKIKTVCLPTEGSVYENTTAHIVGWGVSDERARDSAKILQTATEEVPTNERCSFVYEMLGIPVTSRHVCAGGEKDKGVCFGDSGGPLVVEDEYGPMAIGVASFVSRRGCAQRHIPAVYTAIAPYLDWVKEKMGPSDASDLCLRAKTSRR